MNPIDSYQKRQEERRRVLQTSTQTTHAAQSAREGDARRIDEVDRRLCHIETLLPGLAGQTRQPQGGP